MTFKGIPVKTGHLSGGYKQFVWMDCQTLDIIIVSQIMSLDLVLNVVEDDNSGDKVNDFTGG